MSCKIDSNPPVLVCCVPNQGHPQNIHVHPINISDGNKLCIRYGENVENKILKKKIIVFPINLALQV